MVNDNNKISEQGAAKEEKSELLKGIAVAARTTGKDEDIGFKELYEQSLQNVQLGAVVTGKVVQINADTVMVDVGWKTEGYIPAREVRDEQGNSLIQLAGEHKELVDFLRSKRL